MSGTILQREFRLARLKSRRRLPSGERMRAFRWGPVEDGVLTWPAALVNTRGLHAFGHESRWTVPHFPENRTAFAYWLAHAVRQDLWRRAQNVPGLMPMVRVRLVEDDPEKPAVAVLAGALVPQQRSGTALDALLADLFQPRRMAHWTDWARRKTRDPKGTPDTGTLEAGANDNEARDEA